ncbi:MAG: hypothetical protein JSU06_16445 [Actinobacteria bacterium]|nr:hypothetical protein [Actinomycetota bacterium]
MESPADSRAPAWWLRGRPLSAIRRSRTAALLALGAALSVVGCGGSLHSPQSRPLVVGERAAPLPPAQLAAATTTARRFADAYARSIYMQPTPALPGATPAVARDVAAAATRVPTSLQSTTARTGELALTEAGDRRVDATLEIVSAAGQRFSISFSLARQNANWRVVAISTPE